MIAATVNWEILLTVGLLVGLAMVLSYRLMHRDDSIRRTRYGLFVERDRFDEEPEGWPPLPADESTRPMPSWPDKPKEEEK